MDSLSQAYFCGSNVTVYAVTDTLTEPVDLDIQLLQFTEETEQRPIFGYKSHLWDAVLEGSSVVTGSFALNTSDTQMLYRAIGSNAGALSFDVQFRVKRVGAPAHIARYLLEDIQITGQQQIVTATGQSLGESFSFLARAVVGDQPQSVQVQPRASTSLRHQDRPNLFRKARVREFLDGDTIGVEFLDGNLVEELEISDPALTSGGYYSIRFAGIDTEEVGHQAGDADRPFGAEAGAFTQEMILGTNRPEGAPDPHQEVILEFEPEPHTKNVLTPGSVRGVHGRLVAYVWLPDGRMLNHLLLQQGLAKVAYLDPNAPHATSLRAAETEARLQERNLWIPDSRHLHAGFIHMAAYGADAAKDEWFELTNLGSGPVSLTETVVQGEGLSPYLPLPPVTIQPEWTVRFVSGVVPAETRTEQRYRIVPLGRSNTLFGSAQRLYVRNQSTGHLIAWKDN